MNLFPNFDIPEGYIIRAVDINDIASIGVQGYILVELKGKGLRTTEWVVWAVGRSGIDDGLMVYGGGYFHDFNEALEHYNDRRGIEVLA